MMTFILHRGGDQRFVLQSAQTGELVGLLFPPMPGEFRRAFEYDFGSTNDRKEIINIADFPEFDYLHFFGVESLGCFEFERAFQSPSWEPVRSLFRAAAKAIAYHSPVNQPGLKPIAALWQHTPPNLKGSWKIPASALWVNQREVWMGNRDGLILTLNHDGDLINQYQLPKMTSALAQSSHGLLSICDDGQVYELSGKLPQPVYNARTSDVAIYYDFPMQALTVQNQRVVLLDVYGNLTSLNPQWQVQWQKKTGVWQGWFLQADNQAVYVGHFHGVTCLDFQTGKLIWTQPTPAPVLCGVLLSDRLLIGTSEGSLYTIQKAGDLKAQTTEMQPWTSCDAAVFACALAQDASLLVAADGRGYLYGFNLTGDRLWQYPIECGSLLNLQMWGDHIYGTTTDGSLVCFEQSTLYSLTNPVSAPPEPVSPDQGVIVECFKQGSQLKVRAVSPGYHSDWNVQFPRDLRQAGMRYRVTDLQEAKQGGFYRVIGNIRPLA